MYNPNNPNLLSLIRKTFDTLKTNKTTKNIFRKYQLTDWERQPENLGQLLCSSRLPLRNDILTVSKCCKIFVVVIILKKVLDLHEKQTFTAKHQSIYVKIRDKCKEEYIGQTGGQLTVLEQFFDEHFHDALFPDRQFSDGKFLE